jgi:large subunit ribosomal protein L10
VAQPAATESRAGPRKREAVAQLAEKLRRATSAVVTDYRGVTVKQLEELRGGLRAQGVDYMVIKNTLARRAAAEAGLEQFNPAFTGPVGLALGYDDLSLPAKLLSDYFKVNKRLPLVSGLVEGTLLDADGVRMLGDLPSRDVLLSQLAGTLESPLTSLAGALQSILTNLAGALDAYGEQLATAG